MSYEIRVALDRKEFLEILSTVTNDEAEKKEFLEEFDDRQDYNNSALIIVDGHIKKMLWDSIEPEDARFTRDLGNYLELAEEAYKLGLEHGTRQKVEANGEVRDEGTEEAPA